MAYIQLRLAMARDFVQESGWLRQSSKQNFGVWESTANYMNYIN